MEIIHASPQDKALSRPCFAQRRASALLMLALLVSMAAPSAWAVTKTYTTDADFDLGALLNVNHNIPNQLQLNEFTVPLPFVYVACSARGTAVRIDINTGAILGEYLTAPNGMGRDPSRTTVDRYGNVWVANRAESGFSGGQNKGSIVRIGVILGGERCNADGTPNPMGQYLKPPFTYSTVPDRDGDGLIKTSRGLANFLPWTNAGAVDSHGGVATAEDEAVINYTRVTGTNTRTVAIDRCNDVWVGGTGDRDHEKVSEVTGLPVAGTQFNLGCGGYGGLIDANGVLWSARSGSGLLRYDTSGPSGACIGNGCGDYGLGIDPANGHIWHTSLDSGEVHEIGPDGTCLNSYGYGSTNAQGVAVDNSGNVWVAHSIIGAATTVGHLRTSGTFVGNVALPGGAGPTGVAVDGNGKIWVANLNTNNVMRIDPTLGGPGGGGFAIGAVDMTVPLGAGAAPYNYSDMTGFVAVGATAPSGTWTVVYDGGEAVTWDTVEWESDYPAPGDCDASEPPPPPTVGVEVRAADNPLTLPTHAFVPVANGGGITGISGRYIEIRTTLARPAISSPSPTLYDLTVTGTSACPPQGPPYVHGSRAYSIGSCTGTPGSFGWSWSIDAVGFVGASNLNVPPDPGETLLEMAQRFADSINSVSCPDNKLYALVSCSITNTVVLYVRMGGPNRLTLCVGDEGVAACCCPDYALFTDCRFTGPPPVECTGPSPLGVSGADALIQEIPLSGQDCNGNGEDDTMDIVFGFSVDENGDGVPDECQKVDVSDIPVSSKYLLHANAPNPFEGRTRITYAAPVDGNVRIQIFDVIGRLVRTLVDEPTPAGQRSVDWNGMTNDSEPAPTGVYLCILEASGQQLSTRMSLVR